MELETTWFYFPFHWLCIKSCFFLVLMFGLRHPYIVIVSLFLICEQLILMLLFQGKFLPYMVYFNNVTWKSVLSQAVFQMLLPLKFQRNAHLLSSSYIQTELLDENILFCLFSLSLSLSHFFSKG